MVDMYDLTAYDIAEARTVLANLCEPESEEEWDAFDNERFFSYFNPAAAAYEPKCIRYLCQVLPAEAIIGDAYEVLDTIENQITEYRDRASFYPAEDGNVFRTSAARDEHESYLRIKNVMRGMMIGITEECSRFLVRCDDVTAHAVMLALHSTAPGAVDFPTEYTVYTGYMTSDAERSLIRVLSEGDHILVPNGFTVGEPCYIAIYPTKLTDGESVRYKLVVNAMPVRDVYINLGEIMHGMVRDFNRNHYIGNHEEDGHKSSWIFNLETTIRGSVRVYADSESDARGLLGLHLPMMEVLVPGAGLNYGPLPDENNKPRLVEMPGWYPTTPPHLAN